MAKENDKEGSDSLFDSLMRLTGQVAGETFEKAKSTATMTAMFGESWLRTAMLKTLEPERLEAMAEAGHFLRDARETAGLSIKEMTESLGITDKDVLEHVESGDTIMPLELMLRTASLVARHDPIPFLIKFMRTYNPAFGQTLEQLGVMALPKNYERERRFVNLYRQHDELRGFSDEEYERFNEYMESSISLVLDVMRREKAASEDEMPSSAATRKPRAKKAKSRSTKAKAPAKKKARKKPGKSATARKTATDES